MKQMTKTTGQGLFALGVVLTIFWGCGTTRSISGSNTVLPQSNSPNASQISFVDNVSPNADVIQSNGAGVVSASAVVKIYGSDYPTDTTVIASGTAAANGSFSINFGNNLDFDGDTDAPDTDLVYWTVTAPGHSESLATYIYVGGHN